MLVDEEGMPITDAITYRYDSPEGAWAEAIQEVSKNASVVNSFYSEGPDQ